MEKNNFVRFVKHKLADGREVDCTVTMSRVLRLKSEDKKLYADVNAFLTKGGTDIETIIRFVYGAYRCANFGNDEVLSEEEFVDLCGDDYVGIAATSQELVEPKKK